MAAHQRKLRMGMNKRKERNNEGLRTHSGHRKYNNTIILTNILELLFFRSNQNVCWLFARFCAFN